MTDLMLIASGRQWRLERRRHHERAAVRRLPPKFHRYISDSIIRQVIEICARKFGISPLILVSQSREKNLTRARQITCLVLREVYNPSRRRIGIMMGGRDQQTIWYALVRARVRRDKDEEFRADYEACWRAVLFEMEDWAQ